jgi:protein ImuA
MLNGSQSNTITTLKSDILRMEGLRPACSPIDIGLGPICESFPNGSFPLGAVHEFISSLPEETASTSGFISGILSSLMGDNGTALWISASRTIYPPALNLFGVRPDRVVFVDLKKDKEVMWVMEEALKCGALTAVVGEMKEISFTESRRLQLAVEQSQVTGFIVRHSAKMNSTACVSRWRITPLASELIDDLPGVGFPQWRVELLRMRNGRSGVWDLRWINGRFTQVDYIRSPVLSDNLDFEGETEKKKAG